MLMSLLQHTVPASTTTLGPMALGLDMEVRMVGLYMGTVYIIEDMVDHMVAMDQMVAMDHTEDCTMETMVDPMVIMAWEWAWGWAWVVRTMRSVPMVHLVNRHHLRAFGFLSSIWYVPFFLADICSVTADT